MFGGACRPNIVVDDVVDGKRLGNSEFVDAVVAGFVAVVLVVVVGTADGANRLDVVVGIVAVAVVAVVAGVVALDGAGTDGIDITSGKSGMAVELAEFVELDTVGVGLDVPFASGVAAQKLIARFFL